MILTSEEIAHEIEFFLDQHPDCQWDSTMAFQCIAKAQAEKILRELEDDYVGTVEQLRKEIE